MASSTIDNELHRLLFNLLSVTWIAFKETIFIPVIDIQINLFEILKDVKKLQLGNKKCLLGELGCEHSMTCNYVQCKYEYTIFNKLLIRTLLFFLIQFNCLIPL